MRRLLPLAAAVSLLAAPAAAVPQWRAAPEQDVLLSRWDIAPPELRLKAGEAVRLRFVNNSEQALTFSARRFFGSAEARRQDAALLKAGRVVVPPHSTRTVMLVPRAGRYRAEGGHLLHRLLGMRGRILVE
ncbi:MAG: hypothetical protein ACK40O_02510 [Allosphingosinicella sp.]